MHHIVRDLNLQVRVWISAKRFHVAKYDRRLRGMVRAAAGVQPQVRPVAEIFEAPDRCDVRKCFGSRVLDCRTEVSAVTDLVLNSLIECVDVVAGIAEDVEARFVLVTAEEERL